VEVVTMFRVLENAGNFLSGCEDGQKKDYSASSYG
jgi:hypothetical protein